LQGLYHNTGRGGAGTAARICRLPGPPPAAGNGAGEFVALRGTLGGTLREAPQAGAECTEPEEEGGPTGTCEDAPDKEAGTGGRKLRPAELWRALGGTLAAAGGRCSTEAVPKPLSVAIGGAVCTAAAVLNARNSAIPIRSFIAWRWFTPNLRRRAGSNAAKAFGVSKPRSRRISA